MMNNRRANMLNNIASISLSITMTLSVSTRLAAQVEPAATSAADVVQQIMHTALARCYSEADGIRRISFDPPTAEETERINKLGDDAIGPLTKYIEQKDKDGLTQLLAVKFLIAIGRPSTGPPLEEALSSDRWEVTRLVALDGLYALSPGEAEPFVRAAVNDRSLLLRRRAAELLKLYPTGVQ